MGSANGPFICFLLVMMIWIFAASRENKIYPIVVAMCFLPGNISINIGVNFQAVRFLTIAGFISVYLGSNRKPLVMNSIDKCFFAYNIIMAVVYVIPSVNKSGAAIFQAGQLVDTIFLYLFLRNIIQSKEDVRKIANLLSICILCLIPFIISEYFFQKNLFSLVGRTTLNIRDGEIRATGSFSHAILFGSFAAALIPFLWANYKYRGSKKDLLAVLTCIFFIFSCSSSGPLVCLAGVLFFTWFFKYKQYSKLLARAMFLGAVFIHVVRESPIWHFIYVRISIKASSTGHYRYMLTEAAAKEFKNWWLLGYGDVGPAWHLKYWPWTHAPFTDMTNHYLLVGVRGGAVAMIIFMLTCYKSVSALGRYSLSQKADSAQFLWWAIMVMMIAHCITFLSVAYFGQITMLLYLTMAMAAFSQNELNKSNTANIR